MILWSKWDCMMIRSLQIVGLRLSATESWKWHSQSWWLRPSEFELFCLFSKCWVSAMCQAQGWALGVHRGPKLITKASGSRPCHPGREPGLPVCTEYTSQHCSALQVWNCCRRPLRPVFWRSGQFSSSRAPKSGKQLSKRLAGISSLVRCFPRPL